MVFACMWTHNSLSDEHLLCFKQTLNQSWHLCLIFPCEFLTPLLRSLLQIKRLSISCDSVLTPSNWNYRLIHEGPGPWALVGTCQTHCILKAFVLPFQPVYMVSWTLLVSQITIPHSLERSLKHPHPTFPPSSIIPRTYFVLLEGEALAARTSLV